MSSCLRILAAPSILKFFPINASSLIFFSFSAFKFSPLSSTASDSTARVLPRTITMPLLSFPKPRIGCDPLCLRHVHVRSLKPHPRYINLPGQHRGEHDYKCGLSVLQAFVRSRTYFSDPN